MENGSDIGEYFSDDDSSVGSAPLRNVNKHTAGESDYVFLSIQLNSDSFGGSQLRIGSGNEYGMDFPECLPHEDDWDRLGEYLGKNDYVSRLSFGAMDGVTQNNMETLCSGGLRHNKSIKEVEIDNSDFLEGRGFIPLSLFLKMNTVQKLSIRCAYYLADKDEVKFAEHLTEALANFTSLKVFHVELGKHTAQIAPELLKALSGHTMLEDLELKSNYNLGKCTELAAILRNRNSKVSKLTFESLPGHINNWDNENEYPGPIGDEGMINVSSALAGKNQLTSLRIDDNRGITMTGWRGLFSSLQSSLSSLQKLYLPLTSMTDDAVICLADALINNSSLQHLDLSLNRSVSPRGWHAFAAVFRSPNSALQEMSLWETNIDDSVTAAWANALVNNRTMKKLGMIYCRHISMAGWCSFVKLLCGPEKERLKVPQSSESIMSMFRANHIIEEIGNLDKLVQINKDYEEFDAARMKILMFHFSDEFDDDGSSSIDTNLMVFQDMEYEVLPHVIAWMGRVSVKKSNGARGVDETVHTFSAGSSLLYQFVRTMPDLFERTGMAKGRKRN